MLIKFICCNNCISAAKVNKKIRAGSDETIARPLLKDEIIDSFRRQLGELRADKSFIYTLEQSLNITEDGVMTKLRQILKNEKELDYSILTLLFSGFSIKSISYLFRMSEASLRMRKTRYRQQFLSLQEPERSVFLGKIG